MSENLKFAWRNIWRNKRRTIITSASIFFGVFLSSFMSSMQEGSYAQYIQTIVNAYSGYIQIHKTGYWNDKIINNSFEINSSFRAKLKQVTGITTTAQRLESYALASSADITKGVMIIGINPEAENKITTLSKRMNSGKYLENGDDGLILGSELAKYMKVKVNDSLVLLSQGYHGVSAAGRFPVRGIIKQPSPELDRTVIYMELSKAQEFFSAENRLTSTVIMIRNNNDLASVKKKLIQEFGSSYEIMDWKEINRIMLKQIDSDRASGLIVKGILYMIIAFGIFGTVMMMTVERKKEFGILVSIGMQRARLAAVLMTETILLGLIGSISGIIVAIPVNTYFEMHPIPLTGQAAETMLQMGFTPVMNFSLAPVVFYNQALTIFIFTIIIGLYPVFMISTLSINKAVRS